MKTIVSPLLILIFFLPCASREGVAGQPGAEFVLVPGGSFQMGDIFADGDDDEQPVHEVVVDSFYVGTFEVTVGEFAEFVAATGYRTTAEREGGAKIYDGEQMVHDSSASWNNVNFTQDDRHPVVCVTWYDAVEYCNWLSKKEGRQPCFSGTGDSITCDFHSNGYRLPTEAEWEHAARSRGKEYKYSWGNGDPYIDSVKAANIRDETAKREWGIHVKTWWKGYDDGYLFTAPVGSFAANELGLHDVSGNVYEWCWDWYGEDYYADSLFTNPTGPSSGVMRICRDVGYGCLPNAMRTVNRGKCKPDYRFLHGGFRLARSRK